VSLKVVTAERIAVASTSALLDHDPYDYNTTDPVSMSVAFPLGDLLSYWDVNDGLKLYIELYLGSSSVPFFSSKWDDYAALEKVDPVDKPVYDEFDSFGEWPNSLRISGAHFAATIWVSPDGSDTHSGSEYWPYATFQKAIDEASFEWNDVIMAKPGVYTGEGNRNVVCGGKKITIISEEGPSIRGRVCTAAPHRRSGTAYSRTAGRAPEAESRSSTTASSALRRSSTARSSTAGR
jgi:hypothetical protein